MDENSSDRPIGFNYQDTLSRFDFSKSIAQGIVNLPVKNGFVLGLKGKWGAGKTSVISMFCQDIAHNQMLNLSQKGLFSNTEADSDWTK